jgi:hypothetical protein
MVNRQVRVRVRRAGIICGYLIAVALSLFVLAAYLHWLVRDLFTGINSTVAAASEAAIATAAVSLGAVMFQRNSEDRRQRNADLRTPKVELYEKFLLQWAITFNQIPKQKNSEGIEIEPSSELSALLPELLSWASDEVVTEWSEFRRYNNLRVARIASLKIVDPDAAQAAENEVDLGVTLGFERVVIAMRRDLGHSNVGIQPGDLLGLWINDLGNYLTHESIVKWRKEQRKRRRTV